MDLQQELERDLGPGPALPSPQERLVAGRAALRRRRMSVGAGAVAVLVAIVAPLAFSRGGATQGTELPPASPPPAQETVDAAPPLNADERAWPTWQKEPAFVNLLTGELRVHPDAVVLERLDDLYPGKATQSVALDLRLDGKREWMLLEWDEGGGSQIYGGPEDDFYTDFDDFVAKGTSDGGMTSGRPPRNPGGGDDPVPGEVTGLTVDETGFVASGDTRIIEQAGAPDLPEGVAANGSRVLVAYVQMAGVRQFVLFRDDPGPADGEYIAVHSAGHGNSLGALLEWVRDRYASGEGLL